MQPPDKGEAAVSLVESRPIVPLRWIAAFPAMIGALRGWRRAAFSFSLGVVSVAAFAPFHAWPVLFLTFPCLVWLLDGIAAAASDRWTENVWRAAWTGWWFGFGAFLAGLYWIGIAFLVEADKFAWLIPFAITSMPAGLALFYAGACALAMLSWKPGAHRIFTLALAFFWVEWMRGHVLTGFPWNLWGYALAGSDALMQTTALFGIYGLTLLALLIFASPAAIAGPLAIAGRKRFLLPALCLALLGAGWVWGAIRLADPVEAVHAQVRLRIVQGNIPQADKWKPEKREQIFQSLLALSTQPPASSDVPAFTHLIWPETSVPFLFMLNDAIYVPQAREAFARLLPDGASMILGAERAEATKREDGQFVIGRVFNSLFAMNAEAEVGAIYDKNHLVPFGEYVPFEDLLTKLGIKQLTHLNSGFASGVQRRTMQVGKAPPFGPLICYEAIFPGDVTSEDDRPGWLLNITNDAWFGTSTGPYQHLHQARVRAVEEGLPLVRVANTGISAIIDGYGQIKASLPLNTAGVIDNPLPVALAQVPFSAYRGFSLIVVALMILLLYRVVIAVE
jgi:apolipoprotein N-acyltransferase